MSKIFRWLWQKTGLYIFLVSLITLTGLLAPMITESWQAQQRAAQLEQVSKKMAEQQALLIQQFQSEASRFQLASTNELDQQRRQISAQKKDLQKKIANAKPTWILAVSDPSALLIIEQQKLQLAWVNQQLVTLESAQLLVNANNASKSGIDQLPAQQNLVRRLQGQCQLAAQKLSDYEAQWRWRLRQWIESPDHLALVNQQKQDCETYRRAEARAQQMEKHHQAALRLQSQAQAAFNQMLNNPVYLQRAGEELSRQTARAQTILSGTFGQKLSLWADQIGLKTILRQAALLLLLITLMPLIIRLISFYILAPIAMRRPAISLKLADNLQPPAHSELPSAVSQSILLAEGEELLVRQNYLQSSSQSAQKSTRWLLDTRHPFTSMAAGLSFLTRITGECETTTISAVHDGLAEVNIVTLPESSACVVQPRALAAVVQPIDQPLRITSHWRVFSLSAWLTLQLRYLVFHGPAQLVVKGGRGVRIEKAEDGRIFAQDQLIGFSTDLAYSITRTETFWPYFFGHETLLKDRVFAGKGILLIEEAPHSSRQGRPRRGLEGMVDAILKVFGL